MSAFRLIAAATLVAASTAASAQQNTNIRGTVSAFDGKVITIKSNAGQDVSVDMPENVVPSITKAFTMADVKPGMKLGVTTIKRGDQTIAIDVRPISAQAPEGLSDYDLQPQSTMTNAIADAVRETLKSELGERPVLAEGRLVGLLTAENVGEFFMIRSALLRSSAGVLAALLATVAILGRNRHYAVIHAQESVDADGDGIPDVYEDESPR